MKESFKDTLQEQLIAARQKQILEAATKVFATKGFHATTIKDIAKEAGIAEGTIYNYFANKTALLLGIFERMKASIIQENVPPALDVTDLPTFIRTFLHLPLLGMQHDNFALFRIVVSEMMVNEELRTLYYQQILEPTLALAEAHVQTWATERGVSPVKAQLTVRAISAMVMGLMLEYIMGDGTLAAHWEELPDVLTDLILHGLQEEHA